MKQFVRKMTTLVPASLALTMGCHNPHPREVVRPDNPPSNRTHRFQDRFQGQQLSIDLILRSQPRVTDKTDLGNPLIRNDLDISSPESWDTGANIERNDSLMEPNIDRSKLALASAAVCLAFSTVPLFLANTFAWLNFGFLLGQREQKENPIISQYKQSLLNSMGQLRAILKSQLLELLEMSEEDIRLSNFYTLRQKIGLKRKELVSRAYSIYVQRDQDATETKTQDLGEDVPNWLFGGTEIVKKGRDISDKELAGVNYSPDDIYFWEHMFLGTEIPRYAPNRHLGRFYFAIRLSYREVFWNTLNEIAREASHNYPQIPFRHKIPYRFKSDHSRADAGVLYFEAEDSEWVHHQILPIFREHPEWFRNHVPLFVSRVLDEEGKIVPGLGFAMEPGRNNQSHGMTIANVIAEIFKPENIDLYATPTGQIDLDRMLDDAIRLLIDQNVDVSKPGFIIQSDDGHIGRHLFAFLDTRTTYFPEVKPAG